MVYICAIVKDEHPYIREWALHHHALGFDRIVLYDNGSAHGYEAELGDLMGKGFVEVRPWRDGRWSRQLRAYNDFVRGNTWRETDWCAFIDVDEFIFFDRAESIREFLAPYHRYAGVGLSWKTYNANGRVKAAVGIPTTEAYTREFLYWEPRLKPVARLRDIACVPSPHYITPKRGLFVTTDGKPVNSQSPRYMDFTGGHIKHYLTKSWEDWVRRLRRGNITKGLRTVETFFLFNPDMVPLKEQLTKNLNYGEFPSIYQGNEPWDGELYE